VYNTRANKTESKPPRYSSTFRCDNCRRLLAGQIQHYWHHMRFCSAVCVAAYQRRLDERTMAKIRLFDSRMDARDAA
jgi:hypothetical protein